MRWTKCDHIFFDCDSTLSTIEGIDVLAEKSGKQQEIADLTNLAMDGKIGLEEVYGKRLEIIQPTQSDICAITKAYKETIVEDADTLVTALQSLSSQVYIISGGLYEPVAEFGVSLGVPRERIRAVTVNYNELTGKWWQEHTDKKYISYNQGPLTISDGKALVVEELRGSQTGRSVLIGDGNSDLRAKRAVDLFVGFGGVECRAKVLENSPVFIHSSSIAPFLLLVCSPTEIRQLLNSDYAPLVEKALTLTKQGAMTFNDEQLNQKFNQAYETFYPGTG